MRLTHLSRYAAIAGALAAPLALAAPASATSGGTGSAYGLAAHGLVAIPPTPAVTYTNAPVDKSVVELPKNPLIDLRVLHVSAAAGRARASVVDLHIAKAALSAHLITARCVNGRGSSSLVKASLAGRRLAAKAAPNSAISVPVQGLGTVAVVLNKQVRNANGSLTVTAVEISLPLAGGKAQTISISSATCAGGTGTPSEPPGEPSGKPTPTPTPSTPGEAPKPTPVPSDLPGTG